MKLVIVLTILAATNAASTGRQCEVSEWGDWQVRQSRDDRTGSSFPATSDLYDGTSRRQHVMQVKNDLFRYRQECRADGSCPELEPRMSEGFMPCVDGYINSTETDPIPCWNVDQQAFMNFDDLLSTGTGFANDLWGWTDPETGIEYVLTGMADGTTFVNIQNPNAPVAVAYLPTAANESPWRDVKVVNDWAFIVSEALGHGIQGFDLTRLRTIIPGSTVAADYTLGTVGNCHNIVANPAKGKIYAVGCTFGSHCADNGGLFIVDVSDPANPVIPDNSTNCYDDDGYVHDAQCLVYNGPDTEHNGKDICFCYNEDTFTIVDAEVPTDIKMLSRTGYTGAAYTHQGWLTEDHTVALMDDEADEDDSTGELRTYVWDVVDLEAPVLKNTYYHGIQSVDHNQYILGDLTYQSNYMSGLAILRIDQAAFTLNKIAYFDVFPTADVAKYLGAWSVYPYFASGNIALSSIDYGLYIVKHTGTDSATESFTERARYRSILNPGDGDCPKLSETQRVQL